MRRLRMGGPLLLLAGLPAQDVKLQNLSDTPLAQWVRCGLPEARAPGHLRVGEFPAYADGHELHVLASLPAASERVAAIGPAAGAPEPFRLHEWVADDLPELVPQFAIVADGVQLTGRTEITRVELNPVLLEVTLRALIPDAHVTVDVWYRLYARSPIVEWEANATYGTVAAGQPRLRTFGPLTMRLGEFPVVDFAVPRGLREPTWSAQPDGRITWEAELAAPMAWHRAATIDSFGAILCLPAGAKFPDMAAADTAEVENMQARRFAPLTAMLDPAAWRGHFGVLGVLPTRPTNAQAEQTRRWGAFLTRLRTPGSDTDPRPYAQPPNSGQTGEQPDFGWVRAEHALPMWAPWALHDLRYSVQAWKLRPYANKEVDGSRVLALNHPLARLYNLRPDERFSRADMLGWPVPVGWISGYTTSDSQHRSDNLLFGLYQLTRSPSLEATILDLLELERMAYRVAPAPGSGLGAPRGWGRVLHARLQGLAAGFLAFAPLVDQVVDDAAVAAAYTALPAARSVRVLSDNESKYGWKDASGATIRCWLPWQEAIAVGAFYEAHVRRGSPRARDLALTPAKTIARHGFFRVGADWYTAYGVRWRTDAPGEPLPDSAYNLVQPNYDVFVYGMHRWTLPALAVLLDLEPTAEESPRAREILDYFGLAAPRNWDESCWWALN